MMYLELVSLCNVHEYDMAIGCGYMGAVLPSGSGSGITGPRPYVRRVEKGDVVALPKGTIYWWYNGGKEVLRVLCAGDMSSLGSNPSHYNVSPKHDQIPCICV